MHRGMNTPQEQRRVYLLLPVICVDFMHVIFHPSALVQGSNEDGIRSAELEWLNATGSEIHSRLFEVKLSILTQGSTCGDLDSFSRTDADSLIPVMFLTSDLDLVHGSGYRFGGIQLMVIRACLAINRKGLNGG